MFGSISSAGKSRGRRGHVAFQAPSRLDSPQHFHVEGSKVGTEPTCPQAAHGSALGAQDLAGLQFMAVPKTMSLPPPPPSTLLRLSQLADLVVVVLAWLKPAVFLVAIQPFSGFQPALGAARNQRSSCRARPREAVIYNVHCLFM